MFIDSAVLTAIIGALGLVLGTLVTATFASKTHRESTAKDLWDRINKLEEREKLRDDYIHLLRTELHKAGLPVPPWPTSLL